jgi:CheY-like chemotaxis protein
MLLNARRLAVQKGESELILLGIEDATERLATKSALEDADRKKDEFLAMLGHELRNPLAPVRSVIDVMQHMDIRDEQLRGCIEVLERQSGQMVRLVDDLLEMSRIARGTLTLDLADMALGDAVTRAVEAARPLIEARKHRLNIEQPAKPVRVRGDLVRLTQLFTNLLTNAAKYTPAGGQIKVSVVIDGAEAAVSVSDTGEGIASERLAGVFEPFSQSALASRTGLGIGLPLARRLAELHGGGIGAKSDGPGKGSVFTVRLPMLQGTRPAPPPSRTRAGKENLDGCRVLVVDDNVDGANALQALLEISGCEVRCAYDGESAVPLAEKLEPEVVLLDLALPDIDGYEVLRRLRAAKGIQPALIALSGYAQPADIERMQQAGFDHSLRKPADGKALIALIASLRRRQG